MSNGIIMNVRAMTVIEKHFIRCKRQRRLDSFLIFVSFLIITVLLFYCYLDRPIILVPFLVLCWLTHTVAGVYCLRLWTNRMRQWEKLGRVYGLLSGLATLPNAKQSSLTGWAGT